MCNVCALLMREQDSNLIHYFRRIFFNVILTTYNALLRMVCYRMMASFMTSCAFFYAIIDGA
jgi:hypothetical protein